MHAMLVHFPIALLLAGFFADLLSLVTRREFFRLAAFFMLVLGSAAAIAAYLTGDAAGEGIEEGVLGNAVRLHEQAAQFTLWLSVVAAIYHIVIFVLKYNRIWSRTVGIFLFTIVVGSVARTGYLGGNLVYRHGAGVEIGMPALTSDQLKEE
jgi:uncharacterized membrane protein